VVLLNICISIY